MSNYTHQTAPTEFVEAAGIRFAYRRFGVTIDIPLLFFMHFTGVVSTFYARPKRTLRIEKEVS